MRQKKRSFLALSGYFGLVLMLAGLLTVTVWTVPNVSLAQAPATIRIGNAISLSGPYAAGSITTQTNPYDMWVKEVNAKGVASI